MGQIDFVIDKEFLRDSMAIEQAEWPKQIRERAEALYDHISPQYWVAFGRNVEETHRSYF